jgi:nucleoside-diphosphate-sugar epimerase
MRILITGSSGFLGIALKDKLNKLGHIVIPYDLVDGKDICNKEDFYKTLKESKAETVIHLAAIADLYLFHKNPTLSNKVNIEGTKNILNACQELKARLLFASTCCCYGNCSEHPSDETTPLQPTEPYAKSKQISEEDILKVGLPHCCMRLATFYGANMRRALVIGTFIDQIHHEKPIYIDGDGKQTRTYTYIDDIVDGIIVIATEKPKYTVVNITIEEETSVLDVVNEVENMTNKNAKIEWREDRSYQIKKEQISNKRLRELGWKQNYTFSQGVKATYDWYIKNGAKFNH